MDRYVYQPKTRMEDFEKCIELIPKEYEVVRGWVNNSAPEVVTAVHKDFEKYGIPVHELSVVAEEYQNYFEKARYKDLYPDYYKDNLVEKSFEHFVALQLLEINAKDVFMDVASENSPVPDVYSRLSGCKSYGQDIMYPQGIHDHRIGGDACEMPVPSRFADKISLTCSLEHFERDSDQRLFFELSRVLKSGGKVCVVPFYIYTSPANLIDPVVSIPNGVALDKNVTIYCAKGWGNRFGRFYSPESFVNRIFAPTKSCFNFEVYRIMNTHEINENIYARFALVATRVMNTHEINDNIYDRFALLAARESLWKKFLKKYFLK